MHSEERVQHRVWIDSSERRVVPIGGTKRAGAVSQADAALVRARRDACCFVAREANHSALAHFPGSGSAESQHGTLRLALAGTKSATRWPDGSNIARVLCVYQAKPMLRRISRQHVASAASSNVVKLVV